MVSPFVPQITYSVVNGYRLMAAHQRRHFEQARRVAEHAEFPRFHCRQDVRASPIVEPGSANL
jgi:hypothetical protein